MARTFKEKLYFLKHRTLFGMGLVTGKILNFEDEIYDEMTDTIIACFPVSFHIKHSNFMFAQGTCYDRSIYMMLALKNATYCTGEHLDLEYTYGKGHEGHGWVEIGDYVYDPSSMLKFEKNLYYQIHGVTNIKRISHDDYVALHADFVKQHVSHDYKDFRPGGDRRLELGILVRQIIIHAEMAGDKEVIDDLNEYLDLIEYDPDQIKEERDAAIEQVMRMEFKSVV